MSTKTQRENGLTRRQEAFLDAYIANGFNGTQAAISAGYSRKRAKVTAAELVTNRNLLAILAERLKPLLAENQIDQQRVIAEISGIGFARKHKPYGKGGLKIFAGDKIRCLELLARITRLIDKAEQQAQQQAQQVIVNVIADGKPIEANIIDDDASPTDREAGAQGRSFAKPLASSTLPRQN